MKDLKDVPLMILCGGRGTRLREVTELLPKPMVPIGEQPIVWHIMKTYAAFGVKRFVLCLGYKREVFADYFRNFRARTSDFTILLGNDPKITYHTEPEEVNWEVTLAGTGLNTMTGLRVLEASRYLREGDEDFFLTYGDGVSDVNMADLYHTHVRSGKEITITGVHPEARFGALKIDGDSISGFEEKPPCGEGYVNGGFMVLKKSFARKYLKDRGDVFLEQSPMRDAAANGDMGVYRHEGFWQCMDNPREYQRLNQLWEAGHAPWTKYWK